ncbi:hypothetical protein Dvar_67760 [Desulfosarcina variabilis str. Montpellier]
MPHDIRNRPTLEHADIIALNFVRTDSPYLFRRHFRQGLRSHIMEILHLPDVNREQNGTMIDGVRCFPKASPRRMFRIFRTHLETLEKALAETARVKLVERYLADGYMARSTECIVDYEGPDGRDLVLCGFQEYVPGEVLDPWTVLDATELLPALYHAISQRKDAPPPSEKQWIETVRQRGAEFVRRIKQMITEAGHIPDLAGSGNLIVNAQGDIRLVDINNISPVTFDASIRLDEKGYPVGDKSVEALFLIEEKLFGRPVDRDEPVYRHFLDPQRQIRVAEKERQFHTRIIPDKGSTF